METVGAARAGFLLARTRAAQSGHRSVYQRQEPVRSGEVNTQAGGVNVTASGQDTPPCPAQIPVIRNLDSRSADRRIPSGRSQNPKWPGAQCGPIE